MSEMVFAIQVEAARTEVDGALRHDFDTPRALRVLLDLVSRGHIYVKERQRQGMVEVAEAVGVLAELVRETMSVFGLMVGRDGSSTGSKVSQSVKAVSFHHIPTCSSSLFHADVACWVGWWLPPHLGSKVRGDGECASWLP